MVLSLSYDIFVQEYNRNVSFYIYRESFLILIFLGRVVNSAMILRYLGNSGNCACGTMFAFFLKERLVVNMALF